MSGRLLLAARVFSIAIVGVSLPASSGGEQSTASNSKGAFVGRVRPILRATHQVGRIYYRTSCSAQTAGPDLFPSISARSAAQTLNVSASVREMFVDQTNVTVVERQPNIVAVTIGRVDGSILATRIRELKLEAVQQFNPSLVISAVLNTDDVQAAMNYHGLDFPIVTGPGFVAPAGDKSPHVASVVKDRTLEQILDLVAKTFNGIVFYGECTDSDKTQWFWIDFAFINEK